MGSQALNELLRLTRDLAKKHGVTFVLPTAPPMRTRPDLSPPPPFVIIDYIDKIT